MNLLILWLGLAAVFLIIELCSPALCSIWFMVGALVAAVAQALGAALWLQILLFIVVSGLCFAFLYPRLKHLIRHHRQPTNADMVVGKTCVVLREINALAGTGAVTVDGKTWTARSTDGSLIPAGALVRAEAIEGVKLMVTLLPAETTKTTL